MIVVGVIDWQDRNFICKNLINVLLVFWLEGLHIAFYSAIADNIIIISFSAFSWN